jgi:hypothetical protein
MLAPDRLLMLLLEHRRTELLLGFADVSHAAGITMTRVTSLFNLVAKKPLTIAEVAKLASVLRVTVHCGDGGVKVTDDDHQAGEFDLLMPKGG